MKTVFQVVYYWKDYHTIDSTWQSSARAHKRCKDLNNKAEAEQSWEVDEVEILDAE